MLALRRLYGQVPMGVRQSSTLQFEQQMRLWDRIDWIQGLGVFGLGGLLGHWLYTSSELHVVQKHIKSLEDRMARMDDRMAKKWELDIAQKSIDRMQQDYVKNWQLEYVKNDIKSLRNQ